MASLRIGLLAYAWDDEKALSNAEKHGVTFEEAATAFLDPCAELVADVDHSEYEDRLLLLASSERFRILVVIHVADGVLLRIISARTATPRERRRYEERSRT